MNVDNTSESVTDHEPVTDREAEPVSETAEFERTRRAKLWAKIRSKNSLYFSREPDYLNRSISFHDVSYIVESPLPFRCLKQRLPKVILYNVRYGIRR